MRCTSNGDCKRCTAECCKFTDRASFPLEEELKIKKSLFEKTGTLYIYPFSRFTISVTPEEKKVLEIDAKNLGIKISFLPKKIFLTEEGIMIYDYFIDAEVCPFLTDDFLCRVYPHRPKICKDFPFGKYDNEEFLDFKNNTRVIKKDYEKCLEYVQKLLIKKE